MTSRISVALAAVAALSSAGCGAKLNVSLSFSLPDENGYAFVRVLDPQSREQKVSVAVDVTGNPVDVFVLKSADMPADNALVNERELKALEAKAFGFKRGTKSDTVTCTIPAGTECRVVILLDGKPGAKTQGTVKLTN